MQNPKLQYLYKTIETLWHGVSDTKEGDYPKIINLYKEVLKINPKDRDTWENMIWLMWSMSINKKDTAWMIEAEKFVKMYLSIMPNGYRSFEYVGQFYRVMVKDLKLAMRYYESAIRWNDAPLTTFHSLVSVCEKLNDKTKAVDYCKMGLYKFKNDPYLLNKIKQYQ